MRHSVIVIICALIFSSCVKPAEGPRQGATPTPAYMAFFDIAKPNRTREATIPQAIPTATSIPTPTIIKVSIWVAPYLAETLGGALQDPLRALFIPDAA